MSSKASLRHTALKVAHLKPFFASAGRDDDLTYIPCGVGPLEGLLDADVGLPLPDAVLDGARVGLALRVGEYPTGAHRRHVRREVKVPVVVLHEAGEELPEGPGVLALKPWHVT